jgi:hypothetical protein
VRSSLQSSTSCAIVPPIQHQLCDRPSDRAPAVCDRPSNPAPTVRSSRQSSTSCAIVPPIQHQLCDRPSNRAPAVRSSLQSSTSCVRSSLHLSTISKQLTKLRSQIKRTKHTPEKLVLRWGQVVTCLFARVICGESPKVNQRR